MAIEAPKEEKPEVKIQKSDNSVKFSDFAAIQPDSYAKDANKQVEDTGNYINIDGMKEQKPFMPKQTKQEVEVVEISGLKKQDEYVPKEEKEQDPVNLDGMQKIDKYVEHDAPEQELVGIDVLADKNLNKINVNAVEATELALLPGINIVIAKLEEYFSHEFIIDGVKINLETRICVVRFPEDISNFEYLTYISKMFYKIIEPNGKAQWYKDYVSDRNFIIRNNLDKIIDRAISEKNFDVYYQPIYNIKTKKFNSAESLVRLNDPEYGNIPPSLFINYA